MSSCTCARAHISRWSMAHPSRAPTMPPSAGVSSRVRSGSSRSGSSSPMSFVRAPSFNALSRPRQTLPLLVRRARCWRARTRRTAAGRGVDHGLERQHHSEDGEALRAHLLGCSAGRARRLGPRCRTIPSAPETSGEARGRQTAKLVMVGTKWGSAPLIRCTHRSDSLEKRWCALQDSNLRPPGS